MRSLAMKDWMGGLDCAARQDSGHWKAQFQVRTWNAVSVPTRTKLFDTTEAVIRTMSGFSCLFGQSDHQSTWRVRLVRVWCEYGEVSKHTDRREKAAYSSRRRTSGVNEYLPVP